jgi:hypothetical protein
MRRSGGAWAWVVLSLALTASGETAVEPVRIEYTASPGCLGEREVTREILSRTRRARPARPGEAARLFRLSALPRGDRIAGRLEIVAVDGTSTVREVTAKTCLEVLDALTLVARIAIDPEALDSASSRAPAPPDSSATQDLSEQKQLVRTAQKEAKPGAESSTAGSAREPRTRWRFRLGMGAQAFASTVVSPKVTPGLGVFADLTGEPPAWLDLRGGLRAAASGEAETGAGNARFTLIAARLGVCLPRIDLSNDWSICPIGGLEAGVLKATGTETSGARSATRPWLALGAGLRLEWRITSQLFVELEGEGAAPMIRDRFVFNQPETTVHEPPVLGANAAIGLGYRLR